MAKDIVSGDSAAAVAYALMVDILHAKKQASGANFLPSADKKRRICSASTLGA